MKNIKIIFLILMLSFLAINTSMARKLETESNGNGTAPRVNAEACSAAQAYNFLDINNVRARINTGGDMWWDLQNVPQYEVPKGSEKHSMFSAALWIGGKDVNGTVKVAAQRYRGHGDDYWAGPLTTDGTATIDALECKAYDKHWILYKRDVEAHYSAYKYKEENGSLPEGYVVPDYFAEYPANGDVAKGQSKYLAPFYDWNGDGEYNTDDGDYPYFEVGKHTVDPKSPLPTAEGNGILKDQILKGDMNLWWVFNDKGNIHSESQGDASTSIGFEIRAQAFAFSTNDELNDMTFYSYEIINRSTFRLDSTYFSQWVDTDVGYADDDYVGCDVARGLGYAYNGESVDGTGQASHYGANPPAIGVDFFQGPYMNPMYSEENPDSMIDRPKYTYDTVIVGDDTTITEMQICDESVNGVNFGDTVPGNERFGMRRFLYHNNSGGPMGDPDRVDEYYNMLRGLWKGGEPMQYGGNAYQDGVVDGVITAFMFPGDTDPCNWGTQSAAYPNGWDETQYANYPWTEENEQNDPADRRFMQSAGPFTLEPGAVNYITVGMPWARASSGTPFQSVKLLKLADDKCQALFDNNFRIINGPEAPQLVIQELDSELILYLDYDKCDAGAASNYTSGCNYQANYEEYDYRIPKYRDDEVITTVTVKDTVYIPEVDTVYTPTDTLYINDTVMYVNSYEEERVSFERVYHDTIYRFEGYKVYQLKDETVSVNQLDDPDYARLIAQCDIKNGVGKIVNYEYDAELGAEQPMVMVDGADKGITHSFRVFTDQFAQGGTNKLVNNRPYYFMAIAYGYNNYIPYQQNSADAVVSALGQRTPYLAGRAGSYGGTIKSFEGIPHLPVVENNGTIVNSQFGDGVEITRVEGTGNGSMPLRLTQESIDLIMDGESNFEGQPYRHDQLVYERNYGPVDIQVVDPLNVKESDFTLKLLPDGDTNLNHAQYIVIDNITNDTIESHRAIDVIYQQLLLDYGIALSVYQPPFVSDYEGFLNKTQPDAFIEGEIVYEKAGFEWMSGIGDNDGVFDWIASGTDVNNDYNTTYIDDGGRDAKWFFDETEQFEKILDGTWAPYGLCKSSNNDGGTQGPGHGLANARIKGYDVVEGDSIARVPLEYLSSVSVVFTDDKSLWTRCPVIEMGGPYSSQVTPSAEDSTEGVEINGETIYPRRFMMRHSPSVDKDGNKYTGNDSTISTNENDPNYISAYGMGWFPGYAINLETGERLNMAFGENSYYCPENGYSVENGWAVDETGRDMLWNPTSTVYDEKLDNLYGGMHYIYIFGANLPLVHYNSSFFVPKFFRDTTSGYDYGQGLVDAYNNENAEDKRDFVFRSCLWTAMPILAEDEEVLSSNATVYLNVAKPYARFYSTNDTTLMGGEVNNGYPLYNFNTRGLGTTKNHQVTAEDALDLIRVVPNPYNAFSDYETDQLDNRIRITNLPQRCDISIYSLNGTLVRELSRDDATITSIDWDMKNYAGIPVSSGVYLIHIKAEGIGEHVVKFFCTMRPTDLNSF